MILVVHKTTLSSITTVMPLSSHPILMDVDNLIMLVTLVKF